MRFHPEIVLIALLRLVHFRVALAVLVLRRAQCMDDCGIDNGALAQRQALVLELAIDNLENPDSQLVLLQQVAELHDRGVFGNRRAQR